MTKEQIYELAVANIKKRRISAELEQENRTNQIYREIPEIAEVDKQLRSTCVSIAKVLGTENSRQRIKEIIRQGEEADAMMRNLLTAHKYPADYLDPHFTCTLCNDKGFLNNQPCTCLVREIGRIGSEQLNAQSPLSISSFRSFSLQYYRGLPENQYHQMEQILQTCKNYAACFSLNRSGGLLMLGNTGLGKTHLSLAIAGEVLQKGYNVIYDSTGNLLRKLEQEQFHRGYGEAATDTMSLLLECDLLILDDFGTEFDNTFARSAIYNIVNSRIGNGKPLIINTNLNHNELQKKYGDRVLSRLISGTEILQFYGKDIRLQKKMANSMN
ncbi:MAG: ATP-binding protein [Oscillospiraceae bacterium]|nr:ATP-binding protein [Oscillospiraceae bacterium]